MYTVTFSIPHGVSIVIHALTSRLVLLTKNNINATTFQNHWNVGIGLPCNVARQMKQN